MEEAISRLTLALEELEEKRREEEMQRSDGENWKKIARTIDRCSWKNKFIKKIICAIPDFCFVFFWQSLSSTFLCKFFFFNFSNATYKIMFQIALFFPNFPEITLLQRVDGRNGITSHTVIKK